MKHSIPGEDFWGCSQTYGPKVWLPLLDFNHRWFI